MLRWFANLKVVYKLTPGFGLILVLMSSTLAVDSYASTHQSAITQHLVYHLYPERDLAYEIKVLTYQADTNAASYVVTYHPQQAASYLHAYADDVAQLRTTVLRARAFSEDSTQRGDLNRFFAFYFGKGGYNEDRLRTFREKQAGQLQVAADDLLDNVSLSTAQAFADRYFHVLAGEITRETATEQTFAQLVLTLNLSLGGLAILLSVSIAWLIVHSITHPLAQVQRAAQQVSTIDVANLVNGLTALSQRDLTMTISTRSDPPLYESRDEIGQTAQAMRSIIVDVHRTVDGYEVARHELQHLYGQLDEQNQALTSANARLESLATTDPLTGLANHRTVMSRVEEELSRSRRMQAPCAILFVDLDHFKRINDTWGHQAGDAILREAGRRLSATVRLEDFVGRYGGEEFALVLANTDLREAQQVAEHLRATLAGTPCLWVADETQSEVSIPVTASIGVAVSQEHGSTREALLEAADSAMYFARHTGRNRVCLAGEEMAVVQEVLAKAQEGQMTDLMAVQALWAVAPMHDQGTGTHARRMVQLAEATACMLGRAKEEIQLIRLAALLHDIGKIGIPEAILHKPGPLTEEEWAVMSRYPEIGRQILVQAGGIFVLLSRIVVAHHERWDGSGYPYGLAQEAIPLGARILAVVDSYDAMISQRPYREAFSDAEARAELGRCAGSQFDPQVVDAFLRVLAVQEQQAEHRQVDEPQPNASTAMGG